tara:strand:+ start:150531 stop:150938 length:408 start_codon:yes stop_codon:yes gene_type:complete
MVSADSLTSAHRSSKPNSAFFAPSGVETAASVDEHSPVYDMPAKELFETAVALWAELSRVECMSVDIESLRASFVARTAVLGFKDDVDIEVVPFGENTSGVIVFSRSRIGYSDLGTNRKRVAQWLDLLSQNVKNA